MSAAMNMPIGGKKNTPKDERGLTVTSDQTPKASATLTSDSTPCEPNHGTQADRLLTALQQGRSIDPLWAWLYLGIYRLSDVVFQLRSKGWLISTGKKDVKNRFGESCRVADYRLEEK